MAARCARVTFAAATRLRSAFRVAGVSLRGRFIKLPNRVRLAMLHGLHAPLNANFELRQVNSPAFGHLVRTGGTDTG